jgi:hypothetical protein
MVEDSGMEIVDLQALGGAPEVLADLTAKLLVRIRFVGTPIARASQAMCYAWTRSRWGRRISQSTARQFPLGYFLVAVVP